MNEIQTVPLWQALALRILTKDAFLALGDWGGVFLYGRVVDDGGRLQATSVRRCVCPICDLGKGRIDPFLVTTPTKAVVTCSTCGTTYNALTL